MAELLAQAGYRTGHFGKWHLGSVRQGQPISPGENGFDSWVSSPNFYENNPLFSDQGTALFCRGESSMATVEQALQFIERATRDDAPFLAVIWLGSPHTPHLAGQRELEMKAYQGLPPKLQNYYGELTGIDASLGKLRQELRRLGVQKETLLWYTSDNGARAPGSTGGLRGQKGSLWEGGLRVPAIMEWPTHVDAGRITRSCSTVDILPTVLELAELPLPTTPLDGESLTPMFEGRQPAAETRFGLLAVSRSRASRPQPGNIVGPVATSARRRYAGRRTARRAASAHRRGAAGPCGVAGGRFQTASRSG